MLHRRDDARRVVGRRPADLARVEVEERVRVAGGLAAAASSQPQALAAGAVEAMAEALAVVTVVGDSAGTVVVEGVAA